MSSERLTKKITRREFVGAGLGALAGGAVISLKPWALIGELIGGKNVSAAPPPKAEESVVDKELQTQIDGITVASLAPSVDASRVDFAKGTFVSSSGVASFIFADPGGLLVGPDFGYQGHKSPYGVNPAGWEAMYEAEGSIHPFSPVTQEVARFAPPLFQNLPEGGFTIFTGGRMKVEVGGVTIDAAHKRGNTYMLAVRGKYSDGVQDSDLNQTAKAVDYAPGHFLVEMYQSRDTTNLGFISEGQLMQKVATAHSGGTNCGAEGCSLVTLIAFDVNTQAFEVWENQLSAGKGGFESMVERLKQGEGWFKKFSNIEGQVVTGK